MSCRVPIETSLSLAIKHTLWREHAYGFVAHEGDKPMSTATSIHQRGLPLSIPGGNRAPTDGVKGYGEAVVRYALQKSPRSDRQPT